MPHKQWGALPEGSVAKVSCIAFRRGSGETRTWLARRSEFSYKAKRSRFLEEGKLAVADCDWCMLFP